MLLYLDLCALNRPFDNQKQTRVHIETEAKLVIQEKILMNEYQLVWSYILDFENQVNPFDERRNAIRLWKSKAIVDVAETNEILDTARYHISQGISPKDALHLSCAQIAGCMFFITTDDKLIKKSGDYSNIKVVNPVTFIELNDL
jgi:predicted nucleic acid-binding protein